MKYDLKLNDDINLSVDESNCFASNIIMRKKMRRILCYPFLVIRITSEKGTIPGIRISTFPSYKINNNLIKNDQVF